MQSHPNEKLRLTAATRLGPGGYLIQRRVFRPGRGFPTHRHEFCEFFLVVEGRLLQTFNGVEEMLPAGSLQFCFADDEHRLESFDGNPAVIFNVHIGNLRFRKDLAALSDKWSIPIEDCVQRIAPLPEPAFQSLLYKLKILWEGGRGAVMTEALFRLLTEEVLFLLASKTYDFDGSVHAPEWLSRTYREMHKPENFIAGFSRMTELSGKSYEHLCRMFHLHYGLTPREFILEMKLTEAVRLLGEGASVTEAAVRSGFRNLSYFRSAFRARFAMLPLEYRRKYF